MIYEQRKSLYLTKFDILLNRHRKPWYQSDTMFRLWPLGRKQQKNPNILHSLTRSDIGTKKQELLIRSKHQNGEEYRKVLSEEY
jgi:hypothetical protein